MPEPNGTRCLRYLSERAHQESSRKDEGGDSSDVRFDARRHCRPRCRHSHPQGRISSSQRFDHIPVQAAILQGIEGGLEHRPDSGDLPQTTPNGWRSALRGKLKSKERAKLVDESQGQRLGSCADREPVGQPDEVRSKLARGPVKTSRVTKWLWTMSNRGKVSASIGSPRAA